MHMPALPVAVLRRARSAGLQVEARFGARDGCAYTRSARRLILVGRKGP